MLQVNKINFSYGESQVLWDISLEAKEGEIVAVVGANCAGKTTIAKAIMGLVKCRYGSIRFLNEDITNLSPYERVKRGLSLCPEGRMLFPTMSVLENLQMGGVTNPNWRDALEWVFQLFPVLKERSTQKAGTLSGGEQQMLTIGRALMSKPKLLILDEPSQGLAPKITLELFSLIKKLRSDGLTLLVAEQHVHQVLNICDRAYLVENGRITLRGDGPSFLENSYFKKTYLGL